MNSKKIHKMIIKLVTGICLVVYFTTSGIIGFKPVSALSKEKYTIEYKINSNDKIEIQKEINIAISNCNYNIKNVQNNMLIGKVRGADSSHVWFTNRTE